MEEGFLVAMIDRADDSSVGLVVDMDPEPGERVSGGESVTLYVGVSGETEASEGVTSEGDQATRSDRATAVATTDASE